MSEPLTDVFEYLEGWHQPGGEAWREENRQYLRDHLRRFAVTLDALPPAPSPQTALLELGATPYYLTLLAAKYRGYQVHAATAYAPHAPRSGRVRLAHPARGEFVVPFEAFNVELDPFPYPDQRFDAVLCCELLEHLNLDPTWMLLEIHRILKPNGRLLLTTPNVLALRNYVAMLRRQNIYMHYSGYGIYGRHNREWTLSEVHSLLDALGYTVDVATTVDTYPHPLKDRILKRLLPHTRDMILLVARRTGVATAAYPPALYGSWDKRAMQYNPRNPIPSRSQTCEDATR